MRKLGEFWEWLDDEDSAVWRAGVLGIVGMFCGAVIAAVIFR